MFYTNYVDQCIRAGLSPSAAAEAMGFKRSVVTRWSRGAEPRRATLQRIAAFFKCSVDDLTADEIKNPPKDGGISDEDLMFALFGGDKNMTEDDLAAVRRYVAFLKSEKNK